MILPYALLTLGAYARGLRYLVCHSFVHSFCPSSYRDHRSLLKLGKGMNRLSTTMACNVTRGFCQSAFVLELCMAGSPLRPSWTSLRTQAPAVDYLHACRLQLNCRTGLKLRRHLEKSLSKLTHSSRDVFMVTPTWHTLTLRSALCCLLVSSAVSIANRLSLAAKLLLQTITKELTLQCATRRGFCEICSYSALVNNVCCY